MSKKNKKNFGVIEYIYEYMLELVECKFARNGLKVDGNEKRGGSARRLSSIISLGLWRSRVVFNLNMSFPCKTLYFRFRPFQQN
jgi:hypothetical protein